jgi:hypothetical protein
MWGSWLAWLGLLVGCGSVKVPQQDAGPGGDTPGAIDAPMIDASNQIQHLYVGNDMVTTGIARYTLPMTPSSTVDFTIPLVSDFDVTFDGAGNLVTDDNSGHIAIIEKPLSASSSPVATFRNGTATAGGQVVLTPSGTMIASGQGATLNVFVPPFTNSSVAASSITSASLTNGFGVALDAAANLYVSNPGNGASNLLMFPPPYASATVITAQVAGPLYRKIAITTTQLFVTSVGNSARVDVYTLPLTSGAAPTFSITTGVNAPETVALDADGRLYVGNLGNMTITRYSPPFSSGSSPDVTLNVGAVTIFGIAIGP